MTRRMTSSILKEEPLSETFISSPATWQDHDNLTPPKNHHTYSLILLLLLLFILKIIIIIINIIIFSRTLRFFSFPPRAKKRRTEKHDTWQLPIGYREEVNVVRTALDYPKLKKFWIYDDRVGSEFGGSTHGEWT